MRIEIEYNGAFAICKVQPIDNPLGELVPFNDADPMTQVYALSAFRTIEEHYKRENRKNENPTKK